MRTALVLSAAGEINVHHDHGIAENGRRARRVVEFFLLIDDDFAVLARRRRLPAVDDDAPPPDVALHPALRAAGAGPRRRTEAAGAITTRTAIVNTAGVAVLADVSLRALLEVSPRVVLLVEQARPGGRVGGHGVLYVVVFLQHHPPLGAGVVAGEVSHPIPIGVVQVERPAGLAPAAAATA